MDHDEKREWLIRRLLREDSRYSGIAIPQGEEAQFRLFRSLCNVRMPRPIAADLLKIQDEFLTEENARRGITDCADLSPCPCDDRIFLWQGDITTLKCDAIVNAANSQLLGCFSPCHGCIDNCIHTYAGIQLRLACDKLMEKQGHEEETGRAKVTPAFSLPSKYVIHTVGPIVGEAPTDTDRALLKSCYVSCMDAAVENGCTSIAFCCISTGVFRFPREEAASIAVKTVREYLMSNDTLRRVIFNVFGDKDLEIYRALLGRTDP